MAIVSGKTYLMAAGAAGTIAYPTQGQNPGAWATVRLTNASPFPVQVRIGGIYFDTLPAWTANVYPLLPPGVGQGAIGGSPAALTYACISPANTPTAGAGDSTLYTDFGLYGDTFPGSFPQTLAGQAVQAAIAGAISLTAAPGILFADGNSHTINNTKTQIYAPVDVSSVGGVDITLRTTPSLSTAKAVSIWLRWLAADGVTVIVEEFFTMAPGATNSGLTYNQDDTRRIITPIRGPKLAVYASTDASTALLGPYTVIGLPQAGLTKLPDIFRAVGVQGKAMANGASDNGFLGATNNLASGWIFPGAVQMAGEVTVWTDGAFVGSGGFASLQELQSDGTFLLLGQINTKQDSSSLAGPMTSAFKVGRSAVILQLANNSGAAANVYGMATIEPK